MNILSIIIVGALAGWIADKIMKTPQSGLLFYLLFGIAGAAVGSLIGKLLGFYTSFLKFNLASVASAVVGACLLVLIVRFFKKK